MTHGSMTHLQLCYKWCDTPALYSSMLVHLGSYNVCCVFVSSKFFSSETSIFQPKTNIIVETLSGFGLIKISYNEKSSAHAHWVECT